MLGRDLRIKSHFDTLCKSQAILAKIFCLQGVLCLEYVCEPKFNAKVFSHPVGCCLRVLFVAFPQGEETTTMSHKNHSKKNTKIF